MVDMVKEIIKKRTTERSIEIARNLLESGLDPAFISKNTGLTIEEIETLKN